LTSAGIDWQREKWQSGLGSKFIHQGEKNAAKYADEVIVLSKGVQDYFKETYRKPEFESEQQKAVYWIKHFLEKGDMSANEIYCRLDNEGVSKRVARMVKTEMGIHCYQKKRKWYWSVQPEEGAMNGSQV